MELECVGGISRTLTSIPWAFPRRLFCCSVLNFFDIKVCLCSYWRGYRKHWSPAFNLSPTAKLVSCQKEPKSNNSYYFCLGHWCWDLKEHRLVDLWPFCELCLTSGNRKHNGWSLGIPMAELGRCRCFILRCKEQLNPRFWPQVCHC